MFKKMIVIFVLFLSFSFLFLGQVNAQNSEPQVSDHFGLAEDIRIPVLADFDINFEHSTIMSWISYGVNIFSAVTLGMWIVRIVRAAVDAMRSEGDDEKIKAAWEQIQKVFKGLALSFLFPLALSIIGLFVGIGAIWNWPKAFRDCPNADYQFYFEAFLRVDDADAVCYGN